MTTKTNPEPDVTAPPVQPDAETPPVPAEAPKSTRTPKARAVSAEESAIAYRVLWPAVSLTPPGADEPVVITKGDLIPDDIAAAHGMRALVTSGAVTPVPKQPQA